MGRKEKSCAVVSCRPARSFDWVRLRLPTGVFRASKLDSGKPRGHEHHRIVHTSQTKHWNVVSGPLAMTGNFNFHGSIRAVKGIAGLLKCCSRSTNALLRSQEFRNIFLQVAGDP